MMIGNGAAIMMPLTRHSVLSAAVGKGPFQASRCNPPYTVPAAEIAVAEAMRKEPFQGSGCNPLNTSPTAAEIAVPKAMGIEFMSR